jgi:glycerate 2-kinase
MIRETACQGTGATPPRDVEHAQQLGAANALLLKVSQAGTLTEALAAARQATAGGWSIVLATLARESRSSGTPWPRGTVVVACGGECTVNLGPDADARFGLGGPSQEAAVGAALALDGLTGIVALFADTDGADGGTAIAGGLVDWSTAARAREHGLSLRKGLVDHATTALLEACGDAMLTGATRTNANDLIIIGVQ